MMDLLISITSFIRAEGKGRALGLKVWDKTLPRDSRSSLLIDVQVGIRGVAEGSSKAEVMAYIAKELRNLAGKVEVERELVLISEEAKVEQQLF